MSHPAFPLKQDHAYHFSGPQQHTPQEELWLSVAQRYLQVGWQYRHVKPTGRMDLATSSAICEIQNKIGHNPDGRLDADTWDAIFTANK